MYHLMIADDEEKIRNGIANYFPWHELGFEVVCLAEDGQEAFDYILSGESVVDIILCDIMMPRVSGLDLLEILRENGMQELRVVLLSGYAEFEYARRAMAYGVKDYLLKPTRYQELARVFGRIREELDEARGKQQSGLEPEMESGGAEGSIVERLCEIIRSQYRDISLQGIAKLVYMSPYYISRMFKAKTGKNFYDYVLTVRMEAAMEMLKNTDLKVYEIAERVGYRNQKSFTKIFKRFYPNNPSQYRNKI